MPVHGLIHDGQLRACPCALLGLMHGLGDCTLLGT